MVHTTVQNLRVVESREEYTDREGDGQSLMIKVHPLPSRRYADNYVGVPQKEKRQNQVHPDCHRRQGKPNFGP